MDRRKFIKGSALSGSALLLAESGKTMTAQQGFPTTLPFRQPGKDEKWLDLSPARWIWYPSGRCLPNTFILFRRDLQISKPIRKASGWIAADSRYKLEVNGERIQWGPAPFDPRWMEIDPLDLTSRLKPGSNILAATVLYYGAGDGTWPLGKPGFIFRLDLEFEDGSRKMVVSDGQWKSLLARAWKPGQYKRWYLRALQEEFDARLFPQGWNRPDFHPDGNWLAAMILDCPASKPPVCSSYPEYMLDMQGDPETCSLRPRSIPSMVENWVPVRQLRECHLLTWKRPPQEYFEFQVPDAFTVETLPSPGQNPAGEWSLELTSDKAVALTFELPIQAAGWPSFILEAPSGTAVELLIHEAHQPGGPVLLNTHFNSWSRFLCQEGVNEFEGFDFECGRWLQLHLHGTSGPVKIRRIGIRRRQFPWPQKPRIECSEPALQRLFEASINTLHNSAQETIVDGMGRERQQYSGDCGHQLHAIYLAFGESRLPARYLATYSQGITLDGYFLDCWPAYDRLARLMERQMQLTKWGPILDHGIGFNFDCYYHYLYTGDLQALNEPFPRLLRFAGYLESILDPNGLLPVENIGIPSVWIDHQAYQKQRHKQCAFNLYAAAMFQNALARICEAFGDTQHAGAALALGNRIQTATVKAFWDRRLGIFVNNLPWLEEEKMIRLCDRSLATAILYDQCPAGNSAAALKALADCPPEMGFSYPANAGWRLWALAHGSRTDIVLKDLRERWATLPSVQLNNSLQEDWKAEPDSSSQWSHCPVAPLFVTHMSLAGIKPLEPGFRRCEIRPQLDTLEKLELTTHTVLGPIQFNASGARGKRTLSLELPDKCEGELVLPANENPTLESLSSPAPAGCRRYRLLPGTKTVLELKG
jgi:alpha-L-rhamnosidase